jgi:hypothetical protein
VKRYTPLTWPWRLLLLLAIIADSDDGDADVGRKRHLGHLHPTAHLPPHSR